MEEEEQQLMWYCSMCKEEVDALGAYAHIPLCYVDWCKKHRTVPFCICPECKGLQPHPQSSRQANDSHKRGREEREKEVEEREEEGSREPKKTKLDDLRLMGTRCAMCANKRSPKNCPLPPIKVGNHRTFKLCKKAHVSDDTERGMLEELIDGQLTIVRKNGDSLLDNNTKTIQGSQNESDSENNTEENEEKEKEKIPCEGFLNLKKNVRRCDQTTDGVLFFIYEQKSGKGATQHKTLYKFCFCHASHLTRFYLYYFSRKGGGDVEQLCKEKTSM